MAVNVLDTDVTDKVIEKHKFKTPKILSTHDVPLDELKKFLGLLGVNDENTINCASRIVIDFDFQSKFINVGIQRLAGEC